MSCWGISLKLFLLMTFFAAFHILFDWQTTLAHKSPTETYFEKLSQPNVSQKVITQIRYRRNFIMEE